MKFGTTRPARWSFAEMIDDAGVRTTVAQSGLRRVLVVDDEPLKRITLQIELSEAGYEVSDAADATAAMQLFDGRPFDVVVTDVRMAGPSGLDLLAYVKQRRPETIVILMTAYAAVETAVLAIKRGAHDYIMKPFTTEELLARLERVAAEPTAVRSEESESPDRPASRSAEATPITPGLPAVEQLELPESTNQGLTETIADIEKRMILLALRQSNGNQARAAQRLGIPRTTLRDKMARFNIPVN